MSAGQKAGTIGERNPEKVNEDVIELVANIFPYIFFPVRIVKGKLKDCILITEKGKYKLERLSFKEKVIAITPYIFFTVFPILFTNFLPESGVEFISALFGVIAGVSYALFRPLGLIFLPLSLIFGYEYRFAIYWFFISFGIAATAVFWVKGRRAKKGVYVVIPPFQSRQNEGLNS